jgi:hypothetical protein
MTRGLLSGLPADKTLFGMDLAVSDIEARASAGDSLAQLEVARRLAVTGRRRDAEAWLRRAAAAGNIEGMAALGKYLLASPPPVTRAMVEEGRNLVLQAAHAGNGDAAHFAAVMAALDTSIRDRWRLALAYLGRSAMAGHRPAQREMAFLAGDDDVAKGLEREESVPAQTWHRLHDSLAAAAVVKEPVARTISEAPLIRVAENFLSPQICDWIIQKSRPGLVRGKTYNQAAKPMEGGGLTGTQSFPDLDLIVISVLERIAKLSGLPLNGMEPTAVLNYAVGQEFPSHYDFLEPEAPSFASEIARTGQRLATVLIYLNEDFEGGETYFPRLDFRFKGRKGDALLYHNIGPDGLPDRRTLHAGQPPTRGEKWVFAKACTAVGRATW